MSVDTKALFNLTWANFFNTYGDPLETICTFDVALVSPEYAKYYGCISSLVYTLMKNYADDLKEKKLTKNHWSSIQISTEVLEALYKIILLYLSYYAYDHFPETAKIKSLAKVLQAVTSS